MEGGRGWRWGLLLFGHLDGAHLPGVCVAARVVRAGRRLPPQRCRSRRNALGQRVWGRPGRPDARSRRLLRRRRSCGALRQGAVPPAARPLCRRTCYGLLQAAGVRRIVHRRATTYPETTQSARRLGIEVHYMHLKTEVRGGGRAATMPGRWLCRGCASPCERRGSCCCGRRVQCLPPSHSRHAWLRRARSPSTAAAR